MCHALDIDIVGPKLRGVYKTREKKWLQHYILYADSMYNAKDSIAVALYQQWKTTPHNRSNIELNRAELKLIMQYLKKN